jgi:hypothetical protein
MAPQGWPALVTEAGLVTTSPSAPSGTFLLNDPVYGVLGTDTLGGGITWSDISRWVQNGSIVRAVSREEGVLYQYEAGTMSATLNNADNRFDPDNLSGPYVSAGASQLRSMVPVRQRAIYGGVSYPLFSGFADGWGDDGQNYGPNFAVSLLAATDAFKIFAGITLATLGSPVGGGENSGARVSRILSSCGWFTGTAFAVIDTGNSAVQATSYGDTALNLMQVTADSEVGDLYMRGDGAVMFRNRNATFTDTRSNTSQATFTDSASPPPYVQLLRNRDDTTLANDIQAQIVGSTNLQEVTNPASIALYLFPRTYTRTDLILTSDALALDWAQFVLAIGSNDENRFDSLVINPMRNPSVLWPQVLGREIGDRITVIRNPPGSSAPVQKDCFIRGIEHDYDVSAGTWLTTWTLQNASQYGSYLVLGNAILGQLNSNYLAF